MGKILEIYDKQYKKLLIIPIILLILSIGQIGYQIATTGSFVEKDYSLKGGTEITIRTNYTDIILLKQKLETTFQEIDDVRALTQTGTTTGLVITHSNLENKPILDYLKNELQLQDGQVTVRTIGSSLAQSFFKQTFTAVIVAFLSMTIVVFYFFRVPIPSLAVILAAFSNMVGTLAVFNILGMELSTAGVAAFLMLIGYSVDTDILLSTRLLKRTEGTVFDRVISSVKTGMTMTIVAMVSVIVSLLVTESPVIKQIMIILLIGLCFDIVNTWIQNAGILRMYLEKKQNVQNN